MASSGPSQKFGIEMPASATAIALKSIAVPLKTAARTPSGSAIRMATDIAAAASCAVRGTRAAISPRTGVP